LESDPVFAHPPTKRTLSEERKAVMEQTFRIIDYDFLNERQGEVGDPYRVTFLN